MVMASASTSRRRRARPWTPVPCLLLMLLWWYGVCVSDGCVVVRWRVEASPSA